VKLNLFTYVNKDYKTVRTKNSLNASKNFLIFLKKIIKKKFTGLTAFFSNEDKIEKKLQTLKFIKLNTYVNLLSDKTSYASDISLKRFSASF
jgi:hypothetical protein